MAPSIVVQEYAPARGASKIEASPSGKFLALELNFFGDEAPSLVKVVERASGRVVATGRGVLVGEPDDAGEAFYVSNENPSQPELRSTARVSLHVHLDGPADSFWRGHLTSGRLLVLHEEGDGAVWVGSINLSTGQLDHSKRLAGTATSRFAASTADRAHPLLYLAIEDPTRSGEPYDAAHPPGRTVALDAATLDERWRAPWPKGAVGQDLALGLSGDGRFLGTYSLRVPQLLHVIDTAQGRAVASVPFTGPDVAVLRPASDQSLVALRYDHAAQMAVTNCDVVLVALPSGAITKLWERPKGNYSCPSAFTLAEKDLLLAPRSAPRYASDPSSWGPEVRPFIK